MLTHEDEGEQSTRCLSKVGFTVKRFVVSNEGLKVAFIR